MHAWIMANHEYMNVYTTYTYVLNSYVYQHKSNNISTSALPSRSIEYIYTVQLLI